MSDLKRTNIQLPTEQHRAAKLLAVQEGVSLSEIIRRALDRYLEEQAAKPAPRP